MITGLHCFSIFILIICPYLNSAKQNGISNAFLMQYTGTQDEAILLGEKLGLKFEKPIFDRDDDWYLFTRTELTVKKSGEFEIYDIDLKEARKLDKKVKSLTQENYLDRYKRAVAISDAEWSNQWQLQTSQSPSMNVYNAWDKGYTGSGIVISIVDDGIDTDHSDLAANYNQTYSYDFLKNVANPSHKTSGDGHGTNCAGVAAGVKNTDCVIGAAYDATLAAVRILGHRGATASEEAQALTYALSNVDIYSNSWGPSDDGATFADIKSVHRAAFEKGVNEGRGGLGAIYTWASGNGGYESDDCNADGYAKSIYTIAIAAMSETSAPTWYSEHCSAILTAAYSGDNPNEMITTTGPSDTCVDDFSGTSSACPLAAGIIAQTLQANASLSWRDIQHLIVETSISSGIHANASFATNAAGKKFSHYFGFGLMDAEAMVDSAPTWSSVPSYTTCVYPKTDVNRYSYHTTIVESYTADNCFISYLEFVEVEIHYGGYYRGDVQIELNSPLSTSSIIFSQRAYDYSDLSDDITWTFMSVHFWGEDPTGNWTLSMIDQSSNSDTSMKLFSWSLTFYGTLTDPLAGTPAAGSFGGPCTHSDNCSSIIDGGCLLDGEICVNCSNNYRIVNTIYCVQDGYTNGYCNNSVPCVFSTDECVNDVCRVKEDENDDSNNAGLIAGAVIGGIAGVALLGGGGFFIYKKVIQPRGRVAPASENIATRAYIGEQPTSTHFNPSKYESTNNPNEQPPPHEAESGYANPAV